MQTVFSGKFFNNKENNEINTGKHLLYLPTKILFTFVFQRVTAVSVNDM